MTSMDTNLLQHNPTLLTIKPPTTPDTNNLSSEKGLNKKIDEQSIKNLQQINNLSTQTQTNTQKSLSSLETLLSDKKMPIKEIEPKIKDKLEELTNDANASRKVIKERKAIISEELPKYLGHASTFQNGTTESKLQIVQDSERSEEQKILFKQAIITDANLSKAESKLADSMGIAEKTAMVEFENPEIKLAAFHAIQAARLIILENQDLEALHEFDAAIQKIQKQVDPEQVKQTILDMDEANNSYSEQFKRYFHEANLVISQIEEQETFQKTNVEKMKKLDEANSIVFDRLRAEELAILAQDNKNIEGVLTILHHKLDNYKSYTEDSSQQLMNFAAKMNTFINQVATNINQYSGILDPESFRKLNNLKATCCTEFIDERDYFVYTRV